MKKTTLLFSAITLCIFGLTAQTTLEVGAGKTFSTLVDAWTAAKTEPATEIVINVAEGVYVETSSLSAIADKKITITGAGADKTIVKRSDSETFSLPGTEGYVSANPNRLFQFNSSESNLDLTIENMTFQTMGFNNANGGGFMNITNGAGTKLKITLRNCNFNNIMARAGGIIQCQSTDPLFSLTLENCFIEKCGAFDNNGLNGLFFYQSGTLTIKNTTFMNNIFNALNSGNKDPGIDRNVLSGVLISGDKLAMGLNIETCYVVNNKFLFADKDKTHPMISMSSSIGADSVTMVINDLIAVGNARPSSLDCDLYYRNTFTPFVNNAIFNAVRNYELVINPDLTETKVDAEVASINGAVIDPTKTYTSPEVKFEMDETTNLPKILIKSGTGVKYLNRISTGLADKKVNELKISSNAGRLIVSSDKMDNIVLYNIMGAKVAAYHQVNSIEVSLPVGAYILRSTSQTVKVFVK